MDGNTTFVLPVTGKLGLKFILFTIYLFSTNCQQKQLTKHHWPKPEGPETPYPAHVNPDLMLSRAARKVKSVMLVSFQFQHQVVPASVICCGLGCVKLMDMHFQWSFSIYFCTMWELQLYTTANIYDPLAIAIVPRR